MTPAERNLHRIAASFATLPGAIERATIEYQRCPQCGGSGRCASSSWDAPQLHLARCTACAGTGRVSVERSAP